MKRLKKRFRSSMIRRIWLGRKGSKYEMFTSLITPTQKSHGKKYSWVLGPFKTKRAAMFMRDFGEGNPHLQTVADAERISKRYA